MFEQFYGLTAKPFQLTPDPDFYFRSLTHRKALSYLGYGLAQGEGFIAITGEVGAGKSTLVAHLVETIDPAQITIAQVVTSKLDENEIIHVVAQAFGLDIAGHDKAGALGAIEAFLHAEARAGRRCLLVVDESQNLSVPALEELRMLSNFQLGNHPLLQTLLLGQPEFRATLHGHANLEQLRQRVIAAHHLEPMQRDEIEQYVTWRLKKVGWAGRPSFEPQVFAELFEASGGVPRRVNQIANRLLLLGAVEERDVIDPAMLRSVVAEMEEERAASVAQAIPEAEAVPVAAAPDPEPMLEQEPEPVAARVIETPEAAGESEASPVVEQAAGPDAAPALAVAAAELETLLAARDAQIAELQEAVVELSEFREQHLAKVLDPTLTALEEAIARIETKNADQERMIRQTLDMLIGWMEAEMAESKAA